MPILSRPSLPPVSPHSPLLRGLTRFVLTLLLVILGIERVSRSPLQGFLPPASLRADNFLLEAKIHALEAYTRRVGRLDCLFVGSSVANSNIDPALVEEAYRQRTGETIHCFNLGLPALTVETGAALIEALLPHIRPRLILYTLIPRDLYDPIANVDYLLETPWFTYRQTPSLEGWLLHHSYAYRYYWAWRYWLVLPNRLKQLEETRSLTPQGAQLASGQRHPYPPQNLILDPERLRATWNDPRPRQALQTLLALSDSGIPLIVLEGPGYHDPQGADAESWEAYTRSYLPPLLDILNAHHIPWWESQSLARQIPRSCWYDWMHLNHQGAILFSRWLGEQMAEQASLFR